ncbi:hypothetical protein B566_EDAN014870 [Ephemera danica]|nr:hypothetical protein B566_EDAN014870 [Ephemera danica]
MFLEQYSDENIKIGCRKFAELRPKHCVYAGTAGTHRVCVCLLHENPELMIQGAHLAKHTTNLDSPLRTGKDCLSVMTCDMNNPSPEIQCADCPGTAALKDLLLKIFETNNVDDITYKAWLTVDRCEIRTMISSPEEFSNDLCARLEKLLSHAFIASQQNNFSFIVQNAPQAFHWSNSSATIHVSVVYYVEDGELKHFSHVVVSDCHKHVTTAVHIYLRKLKIHIREKIRPPLLKIIFFSDGSAAEYKNKFNYLNLTYHAGNLVYQPNGTTLERPMDEAYVTLLVVQ